MILNIIQNPMRLRRRTVREWCRKLHDRCDTDDGSRCGKIRHDLECATSLPAGARSAEMTALSALLPLLSVLHLAMSYVG